MINAASNRPSPKPAPHKAAPAPKAAPKAAAPAAASKPKSATALKGPPTSHPAAAGTHPAAKPAAGAHPAAKPAAAAKPAPAKSGMSFAKNAKTWSASASKTLGKPNPAASNAAPAKSSKLSGQLWSKSAGGTRQVFQAKGSFGNDKSLVKGSGEVNALQARASANASATFDPRHLTAKASAGGSVGANLVQAKGSVQTNFGTKAEGEASVGANANGKVEVGIDPRHGNVNAAAHLDGFAGVQAGGTVSQKVGAAEGSVTGHLKAGIGANFDASVGLHNGQLEAKVDIGATLGIGGDIGFDAKIDVPGAVKDVGHAASSVWHSVFG